MERRLIALMISVPLVLMGCSTPQPSAPEPVIEAPVPKERNSEEWVTEGKRLVDEEKWLDAAHAYEEAAKQHPLADMWNEASSAYLMAKQYEEALRASESALKLDGTHVDALYHTGMALLESGRPCQALNRLEFARSAQKDHWQPELGLGRAYLRLELAAEATPHIQRAAQLGAPAEQVAAAQVDLDRLNTPPTLATLSAKGELLLQDGPVGIYWLKLQTPCVGQRVASDWLVENGRVTRLLPARTVVYGAVAITLSNGQRAYLLEGEAVLAAARAYHILVIKDGEQRLVAFTGEGATVDGDGFRTTVTPNLEGDEIHVAERLGTGDGMHYVNRTYQIDTQSLTATLIKTSDG